MSDSIKQYELKQPLNLDDIREFPLYIQDFRIHESEACEFLQDAFEGNCSACAMVANNSSVCLLVIPSETESETKTGLEGHVFLMDKEKYSTEYLGRCSDVYRGIMDRIAFSLSVSMTQAVDLVERLYSEDFNEIASIRENLDAGDVVRLRWHSLEEGFKLVCEDLGIGLPLDYTPNELFADLRKVDSLLKNTP